MCFAVPVRERRFKRKETARSTRERAAAQTETENSDGPVLCLVQKRVRLERELERERLERARRNRHDEATRVFSLALGRGELARLGRVNGEGAGREGRAATTRAREGRTAFGCQLAVGRGRDCQEPRWEERRAER